MPNVPVQMHVDAGGVAHHGFDGDQVLVHPVEVVLFVPDIAVQGFFPAIGLETGAVGLRRLGFGMAAHQNLFAIVGTAGKRGVDVNQIDLLAGRQQVGAGRLAFAM